ncbi:CAP domain-containing protein [Streptomyces sp. NPDC053427]|uniref:CAP domain-containing protein n=1 Tax=Streptomyces sp. NPDC053427 TaxID=3365701 RepID=UPI0037D660D1
MPRNGGGPRGPMRPVAAAVGRATAVITACLLMLPLAAPATAGAVAGAREGHGVIRARALRHVVERTNGARRTVHCPAVRQDARLDRAARQHAAYLARTGRLTHQGAGGTTTGQRARRNGYRWTAVGEAIAQGYPDAAAVVDAWMSSPPHRHLLVTCGYRDTGVGVAQRNGRTWWVQVLATPAGA